MERVCGGTWEGREEEGAGEGGGVHGSGGCGGETAGEVDEGGRERAASGSYVRFIELHKMQQVSNK